MGRLHLVGTESEKYGIRPRRRGSHSLSLGDLTLHLKEHTVKVGEQINSLSPVEVEILRVLMEHSPRVVSPELLMQRVLLDSDCDVSALATALYSLRKALDDDPLHPSRIKYVEGFGYRINSLPGPGD